MEGYHLARKFRIRQGDIEHHDDAFPNFPFNELAVPFQGGTDAPGQPTSREYSSSDYEEVAPAYVGRRGARSVAPRSSVWRDRAPADVTSYLLCGVIALRLM